MSDFISAGCAGFVGLVLALFGFVSAVQSVDLRIDRIEAAKAVCESANSTLVSTDWSEATCANQAVIPFKVKR